VEAGRITGLLFSAYTAYEDGTDRVFRNIGIYNSDTGESPKRKNTTFRTQRKFEIKKIAIISLNDIFKLILLVFIAKPSVFPGGVKTAGLNVI
jgi:hypothetical protein